MGGWQLDGNLSRGTERRNIEKTGDVISVKKAAGVRRAVCEISV